jgi:hypothetical protein
MSHSPKDALVQLMHQHYETILPMETEWHIRFREGDMRPRIEHFHDAVRAYTSGSADLYEKHSRLSVENLAYDLAHLRHIQEKPVGTMNASTASVDASGQALVRPAHAPIPGKLPPARVRAELASHYKSYTVFFAALFAEQADMNFKTRQQTMDNTIADLGMIEEMLNQLASGELTPQEAMQETMHIEHDALRERIQHVLATGAKINAADQAQMQAMLTNVEAGLTQEQAMLDQAHTSYVTGQLMVYEQSKETLKKLLASGLNLAGKFLENAMSASQGQGRGM